MPIISFKDSKTNEDFEDAFTVSPRIACIDWLGLPVDNDGRLQQTRTNGFLRVAGRQPTGSWASAVRCARPHR